jgi:hypothetical protein
VKRSLVAARLHLTFGFPAFGAVAIFWLMIAKSQVNLELQPCRRLVAPSRDSAARAAKFVF